MDTLPVVRGLSMKVLSGTLSPSLLLSESVPDKGLPFCSFAGVAGLAGDGAAGLVIVVLIVIDGVLVKP